MIDYQRTVDELRSCCQGSDQTLSEEMREAATGYREACLAVNARLRRCEEYLAKGLRSEAIQLAESDPPLLDTVATLDFPERPQWEQIAALYGLPSPPKLQLQTAEALNRAYSEQQPLQQLMKEHRRLALSRAPIIDRLTHLRKLQTADVGNPVWVEDIREFERVRLSQLSTDVDSVLTQKDAAGIARVWTELRETPWVSGVPQQHINRMQGAFLKQVSEELHEAVLGQRIERAINAREKWTRLQPDKILAPGDPLWGRAQNDLAWLARHEDAQMKQLAFQDELAQFEVAMRDGTDDETLRQLWLELGEHRLPIPQTIQNLYYGHMADAKQQRLSREKLIMVSVFGIGAVALVILLIWLVARPTVARRVDRVQGPGEVPGPAKVAMA
jgi:hypothetical protein